MADDLQLFFGDKNEITNTISIIPPTFGQIKDYGESKYFSMISTFVATPFDMIAQLDMLQVDFTQITAFEMFCLMIKTLSKEDTSLLFGDVDFTKYEVYKGGFGLELRYGDSIISEPVYQILTNYIRKMHNIPPPKYETVGNDYTKKKLIEYAYDDLKFAKRKPQKSVLLSYVSYLIAKQGLQAYKTVLDIPINAFFEIIKREQHNTSVDHIYTGIYTGNIDVTKIRKKELDYFKDLS